MALQKEQRIRRCAKTFIRLKGLVKRKCACMETTKHVIEKTHTDVPLWFGAGGCTVGVCNALGRTHSDDASHEDVGTKRSKDYREHRCTHVYAYLQTPDFVLAHGQSVLRKVMFASMLEWRAQARVFTKVSAHGMQG